MGSPAALGSSGGKGGGASSAARSGSSAGAQLDIRNPYLEGTQARRVREHGAGARVGRSGAWGALTVREAAPLGGSGAGSSSGLGSSGSSSESGGGRTVTLPGQVEGTAGEVGVSVRDGGGGSAQPMWPVLPHWKRIGKGRREGLQ